MEMFETALGRLVPVSQRHTILEDGILRVLYDYRFNPQNPNDAPMKLSALAQAVSAEPKLVLAALDGLMEESPPKVKEQGQFQSERTFSITGTGVRFVRDMPPGHASAL